MEPDGYAVVLDDKTSAPKGHWFVGVYTQREIAEGVLKGTKATRVEPVYFARPEARQKRATCCGSRITSAHGIPCDDCPGIGAADLKPGAYLFNNVLAAPSPEHRQPKPEDGALRTPEDTLHPGIENLTLPADVKKRLARVMADEMRLNWQSDDDVIDSLGRIAAHAYYWGAMSCVPSPLARSIPIAEATVPMLDALNEPCKNCGKKPIDLMEFS